MNILGISDVTGNHSHSCVALVRDGKLVFALSEERLSRIKNDNHFPRQTIQAALDYAGLSLRNIDQFVCAYPAAKYYSSLIKRSKLDLPRSLMGVAWHRPLKLLRYLAPNIKKGLFDPRSANGLLDLGVNPARFQFIDHHLAHISAAYRSSNFDECIGISYGGFAPKITGENLAGAIFRCSANGIEFLEPIPYFASGCFFSGISVALRFKYMEQEGKTMALAALGDPQICYEDVKRILSVYSNGNWLPYKYWIDYIMTPRKDVFLGTKSGRRPRKMIKKFGPSHVAAAGQRILEENVTSLIQNLSEKYNTSSFVLAGGIFLNVKLNRCIVELPGVQKCFIHPHTGDGSTPIGAALEVFAQKTETDTRIQISDMGLGMEYSDSAIENELRRRGTELVYEKYLGNISEYAAQRLSESKIIGWFQGREEYGPRSLGHRCVLADPRYSRLRKKITIQIKKREEFLPLGASCLRKFGNEYFENFQNSPFMTFIYHIKSGKAKLVPGILHVDRTSRVQCVDETCYPPFFNLLCKFYKLTGIPIVVNSSLNQHGEPIVHRPTEAIDLLLSTPMDELLMGSYVVKKIQKT